MSRNMRAGTGKLAPWAGALGAGMLAGLCALAPWAQTQAQTTESSTTQQNVPSFAGYWAHNVSHYSLPEEGPGPVTHFTGRPFLYRQDRARGLTGLEIWVGDYTNPILQEWTAEAVKAHGDEGLATGDPLPELLQFCLLVGVPHILLLREAVMFLQEPEMVTIAYQRDHQVRRIYLNEENPDDIARSPYGHSVGWYEGDTFVVDTVGMINVGTIDYYGTPHTDQLHIIERYRIVDGGETLEVRFTADDPGAFTMPWTAIQRYARVAGQTVLGEVRCAENTRKVMGGEADVPMDHTPDF